MTRRSALCGLIFVVMLCSACAPNRDAVQQSETHYTLGVSYLREPNVTAALREFLKAADYDPRNPKIQEALAQAYLIKRAYPEAERHFLEAIRLSEGDPTYVNNLGALYLNMQRWDDAVAQFRRAADDLLFAQPEVALTGAGFALYQKGDYLEAIQAFQRALENNRRYAPAKLHLGETYQALGKPELARQAFEDAVALDPAYARAYFELGLAYMKSNQRDKARAAFEKVISLKADSEIGRLAQSYLELL